MPDYYWELIQKDGTIIEIPPNSVEVVKRRWEQNLPIHTKYQGSVNPFNIAAFRPTDKPYGAPLMIEEVAQAFKEPIEVERESGYGYTEKVIAGKWVKKRVTQAKWDKYYAPHGSYKSLGEENGMVVVAFRLPVHEIDPQKLQPCTEEEVKKLQH